MESPCTDGLPKSTTLLLSSLVTHGEMYYMFINTRDDLELELDPLQMVLQTPMALTSPTTPAGSAAEVEDASARDPPPHDAFRLPVFNVSTTLERYALAIAALAHDHQLLSQAEQKDASADLLEPSGLLKLIGTYFKKDIASIDRLVASSHDLPSVDEMNEKRRAIKQIAQMILIIETTHENDYFV
uniref:Rubisco LSMT substrate-binding domain-containing protein n=1 Tax=Panagrolaimus davidi TaxID=227884 RepID=A0A914PXB4_9BILA